MNRFKSLIGVFAFSLLVLALPAVASAQWRDRDRDRDDDYDRNGRYNRNIEYAVERLKDRSKSFARSLDRELDRSRYNERGREDRLNDLADDFRRAADELEDAYDNGRNYRRSEQEARRVVQLGRQLDSALYRLRLSYNLQNEWNQIRQDLNVVANAYGINNRNNRNTRNDRNGDWRNRVPFPLPW